MKTLGERLREERLRIGLTQTVLAEACGVQKGAQIKYEKGERTPGTDYLVAFGAFGGDVVYVLTGERVGELVQAEITRMFRTTVAVDREGLGSSAVAAAMGIGEDARRVAEDSARYAPMSRRELALLDNYRAADEAGKKALETTGAALAQPACREQKHG